MSLKQISRTKLSVSIGLIIGSMLASSSALAQEADSNERKIETIMVTAQKRIQSAQDVPISISTIGEEALQNAGVNSISDVQTLVPSINVSTASTPIMSSIAIRGAGTGASDPTLQPSVGVFIDGVYMPRSVFGISDLVDVDRIEVLLGPQGTLYGKNTNSGVISVNTKGAPDEFEFQAQVNLGSDNQRDGQFSLGYGINDDLSFRLAALKRSRDGFIENVATNGTLGDVDKEALRGQVYWNVTDDLSLRGIVYTSTSSGARNSAEMNFVPDSVYSAMLMPGYAAALGLPVDQVVDTDPLNRKVFKNMGSGLKPEVKTDGGSLHLDYDMDGITFSSITAYQKWSQTDYFTDGDGTAIDITGTVDDMSEKSISQELRISSYGNDNFDWVTGLFYFESELKRGSQDKKYSEYTFGLPGIPSPAAIAPLIPNLINAGDYAYWSNNYESDSIAVFGQGTWHLSDKTEITFGLRYGEDSTDLSMTVDVYDGQDNQFNVGNLVTGVYQGGAFVPVAGGNLTEALPGVMALLGGADPATVDMTAGPISRSGSRDDDDVTGMLSITHQLDDAMVFATVATGAKSGGFNGSFGAASADEREFDQEKTINYEVGLKMDLLDGAMRINTSYFHTVYEDFQAASFDPVTVAFLVLNAGEQTTQGIDLDLTYLITDNLSLNTKVEYLDATYGDYEGATCHKLADAKFEADGFCTLDGQTLEFAPKWSGSISLDYSRELAGGEFYSNLNNSFKTDYFADPTRAPYSEQSYSLWNARVGWRSESWDISLWGKNLTDEVFGQMYTSNLISSLVGNPMDHKVWLNDPRTLGITLRYNMF